MKLLTKAIEAQLPALNEGTKKAYVKFFTPWGSWSWFATEYDPKERVLFGLVAGFEREWGYFSLTELEEVRGPLGLRIERDSGWEPQEVQ